MYRALGLSPSTNKETINIHDRAGETAQWIRTYLSSNTQHSIKVWGLVIVLGAELRGLLGFVGCHPRFRISRR